MITHSLIQGSQEWHAYRSTHDNASDAPAVLGYSSYKTREQLIVERATGITPEIDPATQSRFDAGHRFEALARPLAEEIIGEDLYPVTGSLEGSRLSASFDGITLLENNAFEHKSLNKRLRAALEVPGCTGADLPMEYQIQMEQQCAVSGCEKILFMASTWDSEDRLVEELHCWYTPNQELRDLILAGWEQFHKDMASYVPKEAVAPVIASPMESLPAVVVQVQGSITVGGNLHAFGDALRTFIARIPQKPATDQQFADAEAACKALKKAEDALAQAEDGALAQISDVEQMRRTVADLKNLARTTRLATERLVTAEKDARKLEIVQQAQAAMIEHVLTVNQALQKEGAGYLPTPPAGLFAPCIKGVKSLDSMRDKVTAELIAQKSQANTTRDRLLANRASLRSDDCDWIFLFADFATVGTKAAEDFHALAQLRITQHQQVEEKRLEAERERIRREEQERADREAREKLIAEERAAQAEITKAANHVELSAPVAADLSTMVAEHRADDVTKTAARTASTAAPAVEVAVPSLKVGAINERFGGAITTSADGLRRLGFEPAGKMGAHGVYRDADFPAICEAIAAHALAAKAQFLRGLD